MAPRCQERTSNKDWAVIEARSGVGVVTKDSLGFTCSLVYLCLIFGVFSSAASATEQNNITEQTLFVYSLRAVQYLKAAAIVSNRFPDTSKYQNVDFKEHRCATLAELLKIEDVVMDHVFQTDPGLDSHDAQALTLYGISLRNYVIVASALIDESNFTQKYKWNLNCSGLYGSSKWFETADDGPYELSVVDDGETIVLVGDILPEMYERLEAIINSHTAVKTVQLASRGGALSEAMKIGRLIRSRALRTIATDNCDSSCTLVLIAGTERVIAPPFYSLGFHRISQFDKVLPDDHPDYNAVRKYAADMIGSGDEFVAAWKSGTGTTLYRPSLKKLCEMKVATTIRGICGTQ
jgi:hypothetical protein